MIFVFLIALLLAVVIGFWVIGKVVGLALMLFLAGLIGAAAGSLLNYRGSFLFSVAAGLIGAVVGTVIANVLDLWKGPELFNLPLLWTVVGSALVVGVAKVVAPNEDRRRLGSGTGGLLR